MSDIVCYIPSYNDSELVAESLASMPDWNVVISDNASDEPHRATLAAMASPRVKVIRHDHSLGRVGNWKFCVGDFLASGRGWLKLIAAGDVHKPGALAAYQQAIARFPQAGIVVGNVEIVWPDTSGRWRTIESPAVVDAVELQVFTARFGAVFHGPIAVLLRAEVFREGYTFGDEILSFCADMFFLRGLAERAPAVFLPEVVVEFHIARRKYLTLQLHSLEHYLEEGLVRLRAADAYQQMTGNQAGRDQLVGEVAEWMRKGLAGRMERLLAEPAPALWSEMAQDHQSFRR